MAQIKFSQLPNLGNITPSTIVPVVSGGINYTITAANLQTYVGNSANTITANTVSVSGNITGGNLRTAGSVTATGNITGNFFLGNGSQLTGLPATYTNANVTSLLSAFGSNTISTTGTVTTGVLSATSVTTAGNVTGANLFTGGTASATGNLQGGNILTAGVVSATGNITGNFFLGNGSLLTGLPATYSNANVAAYLPTYSGNITANTISATGNVTGAFIKGDISQAVNGYSNANVTSLLTTYSGNLTASLISTTGNITAPYFVGNGAALTGIVASLSGTMSGNISGGGFSIINLGTLGAGTVSASGNVVGNFVGSGANLTGIPTSIQAGPGISVNASTGVVTITNNNPTPYANSNVTSLLASFGTNVISGSGNLTVGNAVIIGNMTNYAELTKNDGSVIVGTFSPSYLNGIVQRYTVTANFTLNLPVFMRQGQSLTLILQQDATGGRVMTPSSQYRFAYAIKTLSTGPNAIDVLSIFYDGTTYLCNLVKGYA
jgi:hypothetical protein